MKIKKLVNCFIPVSVCNFQCRYCYVSALEGRKKNAMPVWTLSPKEIGRALSAERLGGPCFMNLCGDGETLIPKEVPGITRELLKQGHVLEIVTNGILSDRIEKICSFDSELLSRLEFKFSYHYEQLKEKGLLDQYWANVISARNRGISFTIELTPHDELIPLIPEIMEDCYSHVGALCHITTAYNYNDNYSLLTKLSKEDYISTWGQFNSPMFDFKMSVLWQKRKEYCYAGEFLISMDIASGIAHQCYFGRTQNIYENIEKPIKWNAVGKHCIFPLCFNAHALLVFGAIPELARDIHYSDIRNRICQNGSEWLSPTVKSAFETKFVDLNSEYNCIQKMINSAELWSDKVHKLIDKGMKHEGRKQSQ